MFTYDKSINEEQESYNVINHIAYNKIPAIDNISGFIECPPHLSSSVIALKMQDSSMEPELKSRRLYLC